jgi:hypothetical protein
METILPISQKHLVFLSFIHFLISESANFFPNVKQKWYILICEMIGNSNATSSEDLYISFFEGK